MYVYNILHKKNNSAREANLFRNSDTGPPLSLREASNQASVYKLMYKYI